MRSRWTNCLGQCALTTMLAGASAAWADGPRRAPLTPRDAAAIERARDGAARRLGEAGCRRVFSDFRDGRGRTIESKLEEWAVDPVEYVRVMPFMDGSGESLCHRAKVTLVSTPNVPRVLVCPAFATVQRSEPGLAESLVIHEVLHTLGLGENPPSSGEITRRVEERCR